jgi:RimJ/RimL family protein N-acetyltransferase
MAEIIDASPAKMPSRVRLKGRLVTIEPLDPVAHADALYEASHGDSKHDLWRYLWDGPYPHSSSFAASVREKAVSTDPLCFAIVDNRSGLAVGHCAYLRITPAHRVIEIGSILFTPAIQQTAGATEAMYLMARHAFDDLGYRRYEWKCDARNTPSRRAALRLGFLFEGIFRQHMIIKGQNRDTAWFAMLDSEWPLRKANFERWLDSANFDSNGRQKESLSMLNASGNFVS